MTTLFIHGFASSGRSSKVEQLRRILDEEVLAPSLTHRPKVDYAHLEALVREHRVTTVVGSSMGGFYAMALAQRFDERVVLVNPSLRFVDTARRYLGTNTVYDTGVTFDWTEREIDELREINATVQEALDPVLSGVTWANVLVLLAEKDEVLDARATAALLKWIKVVFDPVQDHRFADLGPYAERIRAIAAAPSDLGVPDLELE